MMSEPAVIATGETSYKQFLVMFVAVLLVLLEVGFAQWPFFYGASPLLSLIFMYFIMIYHDELMPIMTVFIMGLIAVVLASLRKKRPEEERGIGSE